MPVVERLVDPARAHLDDLRLAVHRVGDDPGLRAGERDRLVAEVVDHHRRERARDPLADRDEHVELARVRRRRDLVGELEQLVGRVAHRREDADDAVALLARRDEPRRDAFSRSGSPTEVPPNFITTVPSGGALRVGVDRGNGLVLGRRHPASVDRASEVGVGWQLRGNASASQDPRALHGCSSGNSWPPRRTSGRTIHR